MLYALSPQGFPCAQLVKNPPLMWETWVQSLAWEYPLEKGKATQPTPGFWPGEFHGVYSSWGRKESDFHSQAVWRNALISFSYMKLFSFSSTTYSERLSFPITYWCLLCHRLCDHRRLSIFQALCPAPRPACMFLCQYHAALITVALWDHSLKSGTMAPPTSFFFLKIALAIQSSPFLILKHISNIIYFCP